MIKCDQGRVEIRGNFTQINTELTVLIKAIYDSFKEDIGNSFAKKILENDFEFAFMTEEELEQNAKELQKKTSDALFQLMEKLFKNN